MYKCLQVAKPTHKLTLALSVKMEKELIVQPEVGAQAVATSSPTSVEHHNYAGQSRSIYTFIVMKSFGHNFMNVDTTLLT
jgi:hypothetical protein